MADLISKLGIKEYRLYMQDFGAPVGFRLMIRKHQFPTLLVWGKNDTVFTKSGAKAYLKDLPEAELHLLDAGHFAVEENPVEIAKYIVAFMKKLM